MTSLVQTVICNLFGIKALIEPIMEYFFSLEQIFVTFQSKDSNIFAEDKGLVDLE